MSESSHFQSFCNEDMRKDEHNDNLSSDLHLLSRRLYVRFSLFALIVPRFLGLRIHFVFVLIDKSRPHTVWTWGAQVVWLLNSESQYHTFT